MNDSFESKLRGLKAIPASDGLKKNVLSLANSQSGSVQRSSNFRFARWAAAACLAFGLLAFLLSFPSAKLNPAWAIEASEGASFRIEDPQTLILSHGEIRLSSLRKNDISIVVKTPSAEVTSKAADFLIGTYPKDHNMQAMTRAMVLVGSIALTNTVGTVSAGEGELAFATPDASPVQETARANADFGFDIYRQLVKDSNANVFFSPYSLSVALAMLSEGARGDTLDEIGDTLRLPDAFRRRGDASQRIPWDMSKAHSGHRQISSLLQSRLDPKTLAKLSKEFAELKQKEAQLWSAVREARKPPENRAEYSRLIREINKVSAAIEPLDAKLNQYELHIANAIWGERSYKFHPSFSDAISDSYGTGFRSTNFAGAPEISRRQINDWVRQQTKGKIDDLLQSGSIDQMTRLVLTNAVYFNGSWVHPFPKQSTKKRPFTDAHGEKRDVDMMHHHELEGARYAAFHADGSAFATPANVPEDGQPTYPDQKGFLMLELPYKGGEISFLVVAPQSHDGLKPVEELITQESLDRWTQALRRRELEVYLPKFGMKQRHSVAPLLQEMGMQKAFDSENADFSGMSDSAGLFVSDVVQKTFLRVDEVGVEAAAATGITVSLGIDTEFVPTFRADRPFLFMIRHQKSGTILFLGRVTHLEDEEL